MLKYILLFCLSFAFPSIQAQDYSLAIQKTTGAMRLLASDTKTEVSEYSFVSFLFDIKDEQGQYNGSLNLKGDEKFPLEEIQEGETLRVNKLTLAHKESKARKELKDIPILWE